MAKAIKETLIETDLNLGTNEFVPACVNTSGVFTGDQCRVKRICTKTDNDLKSVMIAHFKTRAGGHAGH